MITARISHLHTLVDIFNIRDVFLCKLSSSDCRPHIVNQDVPVGKAIQFKFILRGFAGEITWQPGPDRILKIWETTKTIVVSQDWDNAENREISEEEPLSILIEEAIIAESKLGDNGRSVADESHLQKSDALEIEGRSADEKLLEGMGDEKKLNVCETDRILVPGLASLPVSETASVFPEDAMSGIVADAFLGSKEAEDCNPSQVNV